MGHWWGLGKTTDEDDDDDIDGGSLHHTESIRNRKDASAKFITREQATKYTLPADPWVLRVRWRKTGMYPPGVCPPNSAHSSSHDLRRTSIGSLSSNSGSVPSQGSPAQISSPARANHDESVVMHLDIQLYEMEPSVYLVDFKAAGYDNADGKMMEEKDVTSPFPFLDLASKLIIQLAEAD